VPFTEYWDATARTWGAAAYNAVPSDDAYGESVSDDIPLDTTADADPAYEIRVGRASGAIASCDFLATLVDVQLGGPNYGSSYGARTPLVTLAAAVTRVADVHEIANDATDQTWDYALGTAIVEFRPMFRADALPDATVKPIVYAKHAADTYDALQFVRVTAGNDLIRFERAVSGEATFQLDCPIAAALRLTRAHVVRAWARWLGADGWTEYGPYSVQVGYAVFLEADGTYVQSGSILGAFTYTGAVATRAWVHPGHDETPRYLDGWIRMLEVTRSPLHGLEAVWRR
jgi:hypothetical protein